MSWIYITPLRAQSHTPAVTVRSVDDDTEGKQKDDVRRRITSGESTEPMEDLISALSGSVHVSQDQYDLKALQVSKPCESQTKKQCLISQEYLAATIALPNIPISPANAFRPLPPSRSASTTRKHFHDSFHPDAPALSGSASFPSPGLASSANGAFWNSAEDVSMTTQVSRPGTLRRTSSYGFGGTKEFAQSASISSDAYSSFQNDAFAPLYEQPAPADRWRGFAQGEAPNPWAGFAGTSNAFGPRIPPSSNMGDAQRTADARLEPQQVGGEDEEAMDEEWADQSMDVVDDVDSVEDVMGFDVAESNTGYGGWERGRRKE